MLGRHSRHIIQKLRQLLSFATSPKPSRPDLRLKVLGVEQSGSSSNGREQQRENGNDSHDGACDGNPSPGGWAAVLRFGADVRELTGGEPATTNNRMELQAAISALMALKEACDVALHRFAIPARGHSRAPSIGWCAQSMTAERTARRPSSGPRRKRFPGHLSQARRRRDSRASGSSP